MDRTPAGRCWEDSVLWQTGCDTAGNKRKPVNIFLVRRKPIIRRSETTDAHVRDAHCQPHNRQRIQEVSLTAHQPCATCHSMLALNDAYVRLYRHHTVYHHDTRQRNCKAQLRKPWMETAPCAAAQDGHTNTAQGQWCRNGIIRTA